MNAKLTDGERLAVVETNIQNLSHTIEAGFAETKSSIKELNNKLDQMTPNVVTDDKLNNIIITLRKEIVQAKSSRLKDLIIQALIIGPISALIGYFFASITV